MWCTPEILFRRYWTSGPLAEVRNETFMIKDIINASLWYQRFKDSTIQVTIATEAKLIYPRKWDQIFWYFPISRTCSFIWTCQINFRRPLTNLRFYFDRVSKCSHILSGENKSVLLNILPEFKPNVVKTAVSHIQFLSVSQYLYRLIFQHSRLK